MYGFIRHYIVMMAYLKGKSDKEKSDWKIIDEKRN